MSQEKKLRWGILGAARVNERLLPAIVDAANAELVAIASRRPGAAAATLQKHAPGITGVHCYDEMDALLADSQVEAVYLPMANHEHAEWALKAIRQGKHVLIEKPLALRVEDVDAITAAAKEHKVTVMEGFMYTFHPQYARAQELIRSGVIGDVKFVRASYSFIMKPARMYRLEKDVDNGGGAMWDIGPYAIHSLRSCFDNEPVSVTALAKYTESGADIATSGVFDFGDGKHGHFDISFECSRRSEYQVTGSKGGLKCHTVWQQAGDVPVISWWTEDGRFWEERLPASNHFILEIEHFSDCVLNGKAPFLSLEDARHNCKAIVAAMQSAAEGRKIDLS
ncbi:Gfo/Idh/MocA family oxidoreductase [Methylobacillus gramineus]|uniref:Gfo/Idh/MocA family protein n=1 Tax=Methylobacillus gramineus TaxID=755169 RepID=UPI001D00046B|nr:Gfo/Idh/MocA family oxidoreductase [Methylobacillus gramineus]MCB5184052.1 Gfo/Idh/MocA family oxidoreductase [Methylobacillus gramineus]